jgi:hypothetical protein
LGVAAGLRRPRGLAGLTSGVSNLYQDSPWRLLLDTGCLWPRDSMGQSRLSVQSRR